MREYRWHSIESLSAEERAIDLAAMRPLYESWRAARIELTKLSSESFNRFSRELVRRLSIETGILERIYDVDRGTTEALVVAGFLEDLVSRSSTNIDPTDLISILRDQEAGIHLVMDCITGKRAFTKGVLHELHATLTRHQATTIAVDQFGKRFEIPLVRGKFKPQPNNPSRNDGAVHEYCPPEHVDTEVERFLKILEEYRDEDPIIVAAWAHHRFTQIHPYQDGNGRVARALTTYVLMRADLLPIVIDRDQRLPYISALENADFGDLTDLATLFAKIERSAILQALSVDVDAEVERERSLTTAVINSLATKFSRRREEKHTELRRVNSLAQSLRSRTRRQVERALSAFEHHASLIAPPDIHVAEGGPDKGNAHWYKSDVIKSGQSSRKFVNFSEAHYFVKTSVRVDRERLVFVTSFHHVGRELSGIMEVTSFARLESYEQSDDRDNVTEDFSPCSMDPFVITWRTVEVDVTAAYDRWLDTALAVALKIFGDRL